MSYEIIYDKQFIKLERKNKPTQFIPMIFAGSNNCYEYNYDSLGRHIGRRARSWFNFEHLNNGKPWGTEEAMLKKMEEEREGYIKRQNERDDDKYEDRRFGYFASLSISGSTHNTSFQDYTGIVRNGCKNALTIEELVKYNINFRLSTGSDYYSKEKFEKAGLQPFTMYYPKTTEEFFEMYEEFKAKTEQFGIPCHFQLEADQDTLKRLRRTLNPRQKVRELIEVDKWWTINIEGLGTFVKFTRNATQYSRFADSGKKLINEAQAKQYLKKVKRQLAHKYPNISLEEHNTPVNVWKTKYVKKEKV